MITDGAHYARCAARGRELGRPPESIAVQQGFAAECCLAACYVAELIVTGELRWRGGHRVPDGDEAAAARVADGLAGTPQERARQIMRVVYGHRPDRETGTNP
ncbi:hypothetical protein [Streptomyces rimosus]|uniref:hypothetical protein n=1 Tax=Streptomyces rimosus TaxID=1927 RepID=UPI00131B09AD|nr:hypothetical protein [Streptomyces rimosus]